MAKIEFVMYALGVFCWISIIYQLNEQKNRIVQYENLQKKKQLYAEHIRIQKENEDMRKAADERKRRRRMDFDSMVSTVEMLSNLSDQEVMRKSKITSGKY